MTAEEYALETMQGCDLDEIVSALEGFAKLKCEELLEIVAEQVDKSYVNNGNLSKNFILYSVDLNEFIK